MAAMRGVWRPPKWFPRHSVCVYARQRAESVVGDVDEVEMCPRTIQGPLRGGSLYRQKRK